MNNGIITASAAKLKRLRKRAIVKSIVIGVVLVGGVTTGILLPNPISMAVILRCTTILSGGEGIKHTLKRFKSTKVVKKVAKAEAKAENDAAEKAEAEAVVVERVRRELLYNDSANAKLYPVVASAPTSPQESYFGKV